MMVEIQICLRKIVSCLVSVIVGNFVWKNKNNLLYNTANPAQSWVVARLVSTVASQLMVICWSFHSFISSALCCVP